MFPKLTRNLPYERKPKTRQQKKDERITKDFVIKKIVDHVRYLERKKKRAPDKDKSLYENEIIENKWLTQEIINNKERINELESQIKQITNEKNREIEDLNNQVTKMQIDAKSLNSAINQHKEKLKNVKDDYIEKCHNLETENSELKKTIKGLEINLECSQKINNQNEHSNIEKKSNFESLEILKIFAEIAKNLSPGEI
ncbi:23306_t:CDS:2 [Racocetra persica]|uniref:23306_t:CDS:1 n=1 Tax=Racocetra persica TaxID=160502 RepID=A0ACA9M231_9GLOM|nr:23306_t:CDS:2 [Racocetra persica]